MKTVKNSNDLESKKVNKDSDDNQKLSENKENEEDKDSIFNLNFSNLSKKQIKQMVLLCALFIVFFCIGYIILLSFKKNSEAKSAYDSFQSKNGANKMVECVLLDEEDEFITKRYDYDYLDKDVKTSESGILRFPSNSKKIADSYGDNFIHVKYENECEYDLFALSEYDETSALEMVFYTLGFDFSEEYLVDKKCGYYNGYQYNYYSFLIDDAEIPYILFVYSGLECLDGWGQFIAVGKEGKDGAYETYDLLNRITDTYAGTKYGFELSNDKKVDNSAYLDNETALNSLRESNSSDVVSDNSVSSNAVPDNKADFGDGIVHISHEVTIDLSDVFGRVGFDTKYTYLHFAFSKGNIDFTEVEFTNQNKTVSFKPSFYCFKGRSEDSYGELFIDLSDINKDGIWTVNLKTYGNLEYISVSASSEADLEDVRENGVIYERTRDIEE